MASLKVQRLQGLIHRKIAMVIHRDLQDPRLGLVTISRVDLTRDLSYCTVFWSTLDEGSSRRTIERALEAARGFIQREVAGILRTRVTPTLRFEFDKAIEGIDRVARLLSEARNEDRKRAVDRGDDPDAGIQDLAADKKQPDSDGPAPRTPTDSEP